MDYSAPTDSFVRTIDVHRLLPQQEPFVMIGRLEHFDMQRILTSLKIDESNIFVQDGQILATGLLESMAQTCAARIGYINRYIRNCDIEIGVIGAVNSLDLYNIAHVGQTIYTQAVILQDIFGMLLVQATVTCQDHVLARAEIKIAVQH